VLTATFAQQWYSPFGNSCFTLFVAVQNSEKEKKEKNSINAESHRTTLIGGQKQCHGPLYEYHHWKDNKKHEFPCIIMVETKSSHLHE
jgi:hypothetical protein